MFSNKRQRFVTTMNQRYAISPLDLESIFVSYNVIYGFAFLQEHNVHQMHPKIYLKKGAFGNLMIDFKQVVAENLTINDKIVMINLKQLTQLYEIHEIFYHQTYGSHTGFIVSAIEQEPQIFDLIRKYVKLYFSTPYENFDDTHITLVESFLDEILALNCHYILQVTDLAGKSTALCIGANNDLRQLVADDFIKFPFTKPYSDYLRWR